jgi:hypothetical protein
MKALLSEFAEKNLSVNTERVAACLLSLAGLRDGCLALIRLQLTAQEKFSDDYLSALTSLWQQDTEKVAELNRNVGALLKNIKVNKPQLISLILGLGSGPKIERYRYVTSGKAGTDAWGLLKDPIMKLVVGDAPPPPPESPEKKALKEKLNAIANFIQAGIRIARAPSFDASEAFKEIISVVIPEKYLRNDIVRSLLDRILLLIQCFQGKGIELSNDSVSSLFSIYSPRQSILSEKVFGDIKERKTASDWASSRVLPKITRLDLTRSILTVFGMDRLSTAYGDILEVIGVNRVFGAFPISCLFFFHVSPLICFSFFFPSFLGDALSALLARDQSSLDRAIHSIADMSSPEWRNEEDSLIRGAIATLRGDVSSTLDFIQSLRLNRDVADSILITSTAGYESIDASSSIRRIESKLDLEAGVMSKLASVIHHNIEKADRLFHETSTEGQDIMTMCVAGCAGTEDFEEKLSILRTALNFSISPQQCLLVYSISRAQPNLLIEILNKDVSLSHYKSLVSAVVKFFTLPLLPNIYDPRTFTNSKNLIDEATTQKYVSDFAQLIGLNQRAILLMTQLAMGNVEAVEQVEGLLSYVHKFEVVLPPLPPVTAVASNVINHYPATTRKDQFMIAVLQALTCKTVVDSSELRDSFMIDEDSLKTALDGSKGSDVESWTISCTLTRSIEISVQNFKPIRKFKSLLTASRVTKSEVKTTASTSSSSSTDRAPNSPRISVVSSTRVDEKNSEESTDSSSKCNCKRCQLHDYVTACSAYRHRQLFDQCSECAKNNKRSASRAPFWISSLIELFKEQGWFRGVAASTASSSSSDSKSDRKETKSDQPETESVEILDVNLQIDPKQVAVVTLVLSAFNGFEWLRQDATDLNKSLDSMLRDYIPGCSTDETLRVLIRKVLSLVIGDMSLYDPSLETTDSANIKPSPVDTVLPSFGASKTKSVFNEIKFVSRLAKRHTCVFHDSVPSELNKTERAAELINSAAIYALASHNLSILTFDHQQAISKIFQLHSKKTPVRTVLQFLMSDPDGIRDISDRLSAPIVSGFFALSRMDLTAQATLNYLEAVTKRLGLSSHATTTLKNLLLLASGSLSGLLSLCHPQVREFVYFLYKASKTRTQTTTDAGLNEWIAKRIVQSIEANIRTENPDSFPDTTNFLSCCRSIVSRAMPTPTQLRDLFFAVGYEALGNYAKSWETSSFEHQLLKELLKGRENSNPDQVLPPLNQEKAKAIASLVLKQKLQVNINLNDPKYAEMFANFKKNLFSSGNIGDSFTVSFKNAKNINMDDVKKHLDKLKDNLKQFQNIKLVFSLIRGLEQLEEVQKEIELLVKNFQKIKTATSKLAALKTILDQ